MPLKYNEINKNNELVNKRTINSKCFSLPNNRNNYFIFEEPIHYDDNGTLAEIDINLKQEIVKAEYNSQSISKFNDPTVGFRNDKKTNKYIGIRHENGEFEMSFQKLIIDRIEVLFNDFRNILTRNTTIEHVIDDDISLYTKIHTSRTINAVKVKKYISDFYSEEELHLKNITIVNELVSDEYVPINNQFIFQYLDGKTFKIPQPVMWNDYNEYCQGIEHKITKHGNKLTYSKTLTDEGKEWLVLNRPNYYIDATIIHHETGDNYITSGGNNFLEVWSGTSVSLNVGVDLTTQTIASTGSKGAWSIYRSFHSFQTSGLTNIQSVDYYIYLTSGSSFGNRSIYIQEGLQSIPVVATDWTGWTGSYYVSKSATTWSDGWYSFNLNALGISNIQNGITKYCLRCDLDWFANSGTTGLIRIENSVNPYYLSIETGPPATKYKMNGIRI